MEDRRFDRRLHLQPSYGLTKAGAIGKDGNVFGPGGVDPGVRVAVVLASFAASTAA